MGHPGIPTQRSATSKATPRQKKPEWAIRFKVSCKLERRAGHPPRRQKNFCTSPLFCYHSSSSSNRWQHAHRISDHRRSVYFPRSTWLSCLPSRLIETQQGEDMIAFAPNGTQRITIEAKGETSSKSTTSRFGKSFDSRQVRTHVSRAFYCAAQHCCGDEFSAIALPKNELHTNCVRNIRPALKRLGIEVFWVNPDLKVEIERIWTMWDSVAV